MEYMALQMIGLHYTFLKKIQYVSVNGLNFIHFTLKYEVPKGSVFGPILFLLSIIDLDHAIK